MSKTKRFSWCLVYCVAVFAAFAAILIIPASRKVFEAVTKAHPFLLGFVKFAFLALSGEFLAARIAKKEWVVPAYPIARFVIWGLIGMWITYMMKIFFSGTGALMSNGVLPGGDSTFLHALYTSATMNLTFGPTFMAVHKCSDKVLDLRKSGTKVTLANVINGIDWKVFAGFTIAKTVPFFWIPAHTVVFLLPDAYQVMLAALLSVALGIILSLRK